jgi:hypothetical protein
MSSTGLPVAGSCRGDAPPPAGEPFHQRLGELLARYDINDYAASVRVFARM